MSHLRQFHVLAFLFFGLCIADNFFAAARASTVSRLSVGADTVEAFDELAAFMFSGFLTFVALHALQWFTSARLVRNKQIPRSPQGSG